MKRRSITDTLVYFCKNDCIMEQEVQVWPQTKNWRDHSQTSVSTENAQPIRGVRGDWWVLVDVDDDIQSYNIGNTAVGSPHDPTRFTV